MMQTIYRAFGIVIVAAMIFALRDAVAREVIPAPEWHSPDEKEREAILEKGNEFAVLKFLYAAWITEHKRVSALMQTTDAKILTNFDAIEEALAEFFPTQIVEMAKLPTENVSNNHFEQLEGPANLIAHLIRRQKSKARERSAGGVVKQLHPLVVDSKLTADEYRKELQELEAYYRMESGAEVSVQTRMHFNRLSVIYDKSSVVKSLYSLADQVGATLHFEPADLEQKLKDKNLTLIYEGPYETVLKRVADEIGVKYEMDGKRPDTIVIREK